MPRPPLEKWSFCKIDRYLALCYTFGSLGKEGAITKKTVCAIFVIFLLAALSGCGPKAQEPPTVQTQVPTEPPAAPTEMPTEPTRPVIEGVDVFGGEHFDEMLWGYYEAASYDYTGDAAGDTAAFRENMEYLTVSTKYGQRKLSVLPLEIQMGSYSQFMSVFSYGGKTYSPYTEEGKAMFRKAYMEKYGDLNEEGFQKIEDLMGLNVAQLNFATPNGGTQYSTFAYEIRDGTLIFYEMTVDDKYNVTIGNVYARYYFLHDGGKLTLVCNGVCREYLANGYKEADKDRLRVSGFAQDRSEQYENLEGFVLEPQGDEGFRIDLALSNNAKAVDAVATFDKTTGDFSVTWTKSTYYSGEIVHNTPRVISGKLIPCTSHGFNGFSGFYLLVDGKCYSYLVSEDTYKERKLANIENGDTISDLQREALADVKVKMLSELEQACEMADIPVSVDFGRCQIALEAKYLFGPDSRSFSPDGEAYLHRFMDAYTAVVLKEEYAQYVSRIVVEGHTDTAGSYAYKQELSMNRADAVAKACVEQNPDLGKDIQFTGCAYDYPIYNDDDSVNAEASNRMVFRFLLTAN